MFLTQGITDKYPPYHDARCQNIPMAVHFAVNMGILVSTIPNNVSIDYILKQKYV